VTPSISAIVSESHRMKEHDWAFCDGCGRKMLLERMHDHMCIPCEAKHKIKERNKRTEICLMSGKQKTLCPTT